MPTSEGFSSMHRMVSTQTLSLTDLETTDSVLYLSFDDGPDPCGTPATLEVLDRFGVRASFFVIAREAQRYPELIQQILKAGHVLGNHSLDHTWRPFLQSQARLEQWIQQAETILSEVSGQPNIGFRSPAGVITPLLRSSLQNMRIPLIHWNQRFYDALWKWDHRRAMKSLDHTPSGSIVLLHDKQKQRHQKHFLKTLSSYLHEVNARGFRMEAIPHGLKTDFLHQPIKRIESDSGIRPLRQNLRNNTSDVENARVPIP